MVANGTALRVAERAVSTRGGLPDYLSRRTALELVVFDLLIAAAAVIAAFPSSIEFDLGSLVALAAVLPGVSALTRSALLAAGTPGGLTLDHLDPGAERGDEVPLESARHTAAGGLGLLMFGSVAAAAAIILI